MKELVNKKGNKFYKLKEETINRAQEELGIILPRELKDFYKQIGYGFLHSKIYRFNRIMSPNCLCEFRFRKGQYDDSELEIYEEYEKNTLIFFEMSEGSYLSIGFTKNNNSKIYDGKTKIANSLKEFLEKYQEDEKYFD